MYAQKFVKIGRHNRGAPLPREMSAKRFGLTSTGPNIGLMGPRVRGLIALALIPPDVHRRTVLMIPNIVGPTNSGSPY